MDEASVPGGSLDVELPDADKQVQVLLREFPADAEDDADEQLLAWAKRLKTVHRFTPYAR